MPQDPPHEPQDEPAAAVPDPRDRRKGDRRSPERDSKDSATEGKERRGADRRESPDVPDEYRSKQRSINEYPLSSEELEFINAINAYKQAYAKPFPTWSEVLHILRALGYRKSASPTPVKGEGD